MFSGGSFDVLVWLLIIELLSFAVLPYVVLSFTAPSSGENLSEKSSPQNYSNDFGYGVSKLLGILIFGLVTWLPATLGLVDVSRGWVTVCFLLILTVGYFRWVNAGPQESKILQSVIWRNIALVEGLFFTLTFFFLAIRFLNPEIFWGEKPMDSTFLHFFTRNESFPPQDPWGAGHQMSYYYLGIYFLGAVLKLSGIPVSIGYNLAIATLAGLIGTALYTLFMQLTRSRITALLGAIAIVLGSDPEVLRLTIIEGRPPNFDTFWASTRVLTSPHFYEYTSWSLLFADLHAHVISIPFTVTLITLAVTLYKGSGVRYATSGIMLRILLGLLLGSIYAINTWDVITFGAVAGLLVLFAPCKKFWDPPVRPDGSVSLIEKIFAFTFPRAIGAFWDGLFIGLPALIVALPYSIQSGAKNKIHSGWAAPGEFNEVGQVILMIGYWFALIILSAVVISTISRQSLRQLLARVAVILLSTAGVLLLPLRNPFADTSNQPWGLLILGALFTGLFISLIVVRSRTTGSQDVPICIIGLSGAALILILEEFFLIDRMNTIFKGYIAVWMLFAVTAVCFAHKLFEYISREGDRKSLAFTAIPVALLFVASSIGTALNCLAVVDLQRVPTRVRTLDGAAYVDISDPGDALAIGWLNHFVDKTPTLLEAWGSSYREFTRISMHTGLPAVLGWEHHVQQRGLPHAEFQERREAVTTIYSGTDLLLTKMLLLKYRVEFIVVGEIERKTYGPGGIQKFFDHPELFKQVISGAGTTLFVTNFSEYFQKQSSSAR